MLGRRPAWRRLESYAEAIEVAESAVQPSGPFTWRLLAQQTGSWVDAAALRPRDSACSKASTASAKRPSVCSRMPIMLTASGWSRSRARAQRSQLHAPAASFSEVRNWHQAICVSTCSGFRAKALRRCPSASVGRRRSRSSMGLHHDCASGVPRFSSSIPLCAQWA
jgi:hypothetical protein